MIKLVFSLCIILFITPLFCQIDYYIETDETSYFYGQDIHITFNLQNTTSDTVIVTWGELPPYDYYIDDDFFDIGAYQIILDVAIPPNSTNSLTYIHTDNVSIGNHIIIGEFNSSWLSDPVLITVETVSVEKQDLIITDYQLSNYPNPFNPTTEISFEITNLHEESRIEIYNSRGQRINQFSIFNNQSSITWDGTNSTGKTCPSGVYLYKLVSGGRKLATNKMLLLK